MKKSLIQTLFFVAILMLSAQTFAFNSGTPDKNIKTQAATDSLRKEVTQMVQNADLWGNSIEEEDVMIQFSVNDAGEVVVKNIVAQSEYLKEFVAQKINQKKVGVAGVETGVNYYLKISFKARV